MKIGDFNLLHLISRPRLGDSIKFFLDLWGQKVDSLDYRMALFC